MKKISWGMSASTLILACALPVQGFQQMQMSFICISAGDANNCAIGEEQLRLEIADAGMGRIALILSNVGTEPSTLARIYLDDRRGTLIGSPEILDDPPSVAFDPGARPRNLPGWRNAQPPFRATPGMAVHAARPSRSTGLNEGESITLLYALAGDRTVADVIEDLRSGELRCGVQVIGYASGGRASFVNRALLYEVLESEGF